MGKHHGSGSEGRKSIKTAPKNCLMPLLKPIAAAAHALATPSVQKAAPGWENTMAVKDGKASKLRPKTAERNFWNQ